MTNGDEFRRRISNGRSNGLAGVEICPSEPSGLMESHLDLDLAAEGHLQAFAADRN